MAALGRPVSIALPIQDGRGRPSYDPIPLGDLKPPELRSRPDPRSKDTNMPTTAKTKAKAKPRATKTSEPEIPIEDIVWGAFAGDPIYLEAMKLGREYRESLRPKANANRNLVEK